MWFDWIKAVYQALVETYQAWRAKRDEHQIDKLGEKVMYETPTTILKAEEMKEKSKFVKVKTELVKIKTDAVKAKLH